MWIGPTAPPAQIFPHLQQYSCMAKMRSHSTVLMPIAFVVLWVFCAHFSVSVGQHVTEATAQQQPAAPQPDDVFTSAARLHRIFLVERNIAQFLRQYATSVEAKLAKVKRYLEEYNQLGEEDIKTEEQFVEKIVGNPIYAFRMVKRFAVDLEAIWRSEPALDSRYLENEVRKIHAVNIPRESDLAGAGMSLARVHHTYNLNLTDLSRGQVWGFPSKAGLTAADCLYVGKLSYNQGMFARAAEWFEESYRLAGLEKNRTVAQQEALDFLEMAIRAHDDQLMEQRRKQENEKAPVFLPPSEGGHLYPEPIRVKPPAQQNLEISQAPKKHCLGLKCAQEHEMINYNALCRGEQLLSDKALSKLKCHLDRKSHPFFILKPAKVEVLHRNPEIFLFHDLISDRVIQRIKELAEPTLHRSGVVNEYDVQSSMVSEVRTSKGTWLEDTDDVVVAKMTEQVGRLTGLSMELVEKFQIANYGIGGHFHSHYDTLYLSKDPTTVKNIPEDQLRDGDRIATLMYYLTDVARGGATVFPKLGVGLWPVKGAAVFWYNMKRNGENDWLTLHAACPVVHGSKWVANKWIRVNDQISTRPCTLNENE